MSVHTLFESLPEAGTPHGATGAYEHASYGGSNLWPAVERLVDRAPLVSDLRAHRLHLLAAKQWRAEGRPVPAELVDAERVAAVFALGAPLVLARARAAYDGALVLMKGPEVGSSYPHPITRPFRDLDLLAEDAHEAQRALIAAGFDPVGDPERYEDIHHLRPLRLPELPLLVEIHDRPKWIDRQSAPAKRELISASGPSSLGIDGILALPPDYHAMVLAAHAWAHAPLTRLLDLVDVAALSERADDGGLEQLARRWGMGRAWRSTRSAIDGAIYGRSRPLSTRIWARNLAGVRERTVFESHLERFLLPFWETSPARAARLSVSAFGREFGRAPGDRWQTKLSRVLRAFRSPSSRLSEHEQDDGHGR